MAKNNTQYLLNLVEHPLGLDDRFRFHCTQCGVCCRNRADILLAPYDICRIAKYLGISNLEVVRKYCFTYIGENSHIPLVAMNMENSPCPFLKNNKCSIHDAKPVICAIYPLGRFAKIESQEIAYFVQPVSCGTKSETHTPREWMSSFDISESETWFSVWQNCVTEMSMLINKIDADRFENALTQMYNILTGILYIRYDPNKPITPQIKQNMTYALAIVREASEYACRVS